MLKEDLKDAAQILHNILSQSLQVEGAEENITLAKAAEKYKDEGEDSDLSKVLKNFAKYPDSATTLVRELELILDDIKKR